MMNKLKRIFLPVSVLLILVSLVLFPFPAQAGKKPNAVYGSGKSELVLATGSPGALGLVEALAAPFCRDHDCRLVWFKKGSGASLAFMKAGKCDVVMVHAPAAEKLEH